MIYVPFVSISSVPVGLVLEFRREEHVEQGLVVSLSVLYVVEHKQGKLLNAVLALEVVREDAELLEGQVLELRVGGQDDAAE